MKINRLETLLRKYLPKISLKKDLSHTFELMFQNSEVVIDRERANIILSYFDTPPMASSFYAHYFPEKIKSEEHLICGLDNIIKDMLWHFGDIMRGYLFLRKQNDIDAFFKAHQFDVEEMKNRLPWHLVDDIKPEERGFLGYVSGQRPIKENELLGLAQKIVIELEENKAEYDGLIETEKVQKLIERLSESDSNIENSIHELQKYEKENNLDLFQSASYDELNSKIGYLKSEVEQLIKKIERLKDVGRKNQEHYLRNIDSIDVYVATSMRNDDEYLDMYNFVNSTFEDENIKSLNLRYFDPTLCYCASRIDKGIIECLLVRSAKVTIYCAQEGDTFGKDSELAATMAQGKPVIVYVPTASPNDLDILSLKESDRNEQYNKKKKKLDDRAKVFKEFHPLGLQVGLYDGVARGVIVVRTPEECASVLYKILTNSLEVEYRNEEDGMVLREKETKSIVRVMTGWDVLAQCFWHQFDRTLNPKAGLPT